MIRKVLVTLGVSAMLLAVSCSRDEEFTVEEPTAVAEEQTGILSKNQLDDYIVETINRTGTSFDWSSAPDNVVWSAMLLSEQIAIVGYKVSGWSTEQSRQFMLDNDIEKRGLSGEILKIKSELLQIASEKEAESGQTDRSEMIVYENDKFLSLYLKINSIETLKALRQSENVRYVEPTYHPFVEEITKNYEQTTPEGSGLYTVGCGTYGPNFSLRPNFDYATIAPDAKISWNYRYHKIKEAWETGGVSGRGTGKGIGVAILDTGLGLSQGSLSSTSGLNAGYVTGRTLSTWNLLDRSQSVDDFCGHGTALAGTIAAPRRGIGTMVGVAYGSNLYSYKVAEGVLIFGSAAIRAVTDAYYVSGNTANIRITSLSMGNVVRITEVADAIVYAYERGKLNFAAAGTAAYASWFSVPFANLSNIVFPANMTEYGGEVVMGVTGITTTYERCVDCVQGPTVDFAVVMQQSNGTTPLAMARTSNWPTTIGGSSVATATMAGIAAIVWGKTSTRPRADVVSALKATSDFPSRSNPIFGHGKANAQAAWNVMSN